MPINQYYEVRVEIRAGTQEEAEQIARDILDIDGVASIDSVCVAQNK